MVGGDVGGLDGFDVGGAAARDYFCKSDQRGPSFPPGLFPYHQIMSV